MELEAGTSRQPPNVEKMMENLLETTSLRIGEHNVILYRPRLSSLIEKASIQPKQRKKLSSLLKKKWGAIDESYYLPSLITLLSERVGGISKVIGFPVGPLIAHFYEEECRFRHVLGLADAVHISLFNLGIKVSFPQLTLRKTNSTFTLSTTGGKVLSRNPRDILLHPVRVKRYLALGRRKAIDGKDFTYRPILLPDTSSGPGKDPLASSKRVLHRLTTKNRRFRLILHYLRVFPHNLEEKLYVKIIKNSLSDEFSVQMGQDRPLCSEGRVPLFPVPTQKRLDKRFSRNWKDRCRFYKNLLESKSLCAPVGSDLIREAYVKHKESLCRPEGDVVPVPDEFLKELYSYGQTVGRYVERVYKPYETKLPNTKATVEANRRKGGARAALKGSLEIQKGPLYLSLLQDVSRPEPFVVGLFGPPGSGKTTTTHQLIMVLGAALFPARTGNELVYSRSCSMKHWDGYTGQPIVVLDDFGQDLSDRSDLVEFEQLVSVNRYQLPMADLESKGTCFTSPIIILTSNCGFGLPLKDKNNLFVVEDSMAVWRRFHLPIRVMKKSMLDSVPLPSWGDGTYQVGKESRFKRDREEWEKSRSSKRDLICYDRYTLKNLIVEYEQHWMSKHISRQGELHRGSHTFYRQPGPHSPGILDDNGSYDSSSDLAVDIILRFKEHVGYHCSELSGTWRQVISCLNVHERPSSLRPLHEVFVERRIVAVNDEDVTISQLFPAFPPSRAPIVDAVAIPEPLKVRMITKAEADTKCLQPLQRALFKYLKTQPQFSLTHGVNFGESIEFEEKLEWIYRIESEVSGIHDRMSGGDLWLSGDYTAATDNFPLSVTNALVEGILSQISHEPTKRWVRYEVSPHRIRYPMGLGVGKQTSGQLMGSLLSFPLLCFLNDFIVSRAGFEKGKYLINGDDVVAAGTEEYIRRWRDSAPLVGLSLSQGKNFIHSRFCTVNSQLFIDGKVQHTGKVSLTRRTGKTLSRCFAELQFYYGLDGELRREFIRRNLLELRNTPRSLSVPTSHGGLGLFFDEDLSSGLRQVACRVYLHDACRPFLKSLPVPGMPHLRALRVPCGIFRNEEMVLGGGNPIENEVFELLQGLEVEPQEVPEASDLLHSELKKVCSLLESANARRYNQLCSGSIEDFPPLRDIRFRTIFIEKGKVGFIKERVLSMVLDFLHSSCGKDRNRELDPDQAFIEIHREFLEDLDPLFGDGILFDFSMKEEVGEPPPSDQFIDRYKHLLPGLEPRWVINDHTNGDLVSLVRGSGASEHLFTP